MSCSYASTSERHAPREEQRPEVARRRDEPPPDADAALREQLALVGEVRGEERDEQHLGDLARLEAERTDPDPEPAATASTDR